MRQFRLTYASAGGTLQRDAMLLCRRVDGRCSDQSNSMIDTSVNMLASYAMWHDANCLTLTSYGGHAKRQECVWAYPPRLGARHRLHHPCSVIQQTRPCRPASTEGGRQVQATIAITPLCCLHIISRHPPPLTSCACPWPTKSHY